MPGETKKWDDAAERDLCVAMIMSSQDDKGRPMYNWPKVHATMTSLGYSFTKDAMSQHYTKTILKEHKARHGDNAAKGGAVSVISTPTKAAAASKKSTPASKKRAKGKKSEEFVGEDADDDDKDAVTRSAKKMKADPDTPVKPKRERSATILDNEAEFARWAVTGKAE